MRVFTWLDVLAMKWLIRRHPTLRTAFERWLDDAVRDIQQQLTKWQKP